MTKAEDAIAVLQHLKKEIIANMYRNTYCENVFLENEYIKAINTAIETLEQAFKTGG